MPQLKNVAILTHQELENLKVTKKKINGDIRLNNTRQIKNLHILLCTLQLILIPLPTNQMAFD